MKKTKTILLGVLNNQILTCDLELRDWNGYNEFSACFNLGEAFNIEDINEDYRKDYHEEIWNCLEATQKLDYLEDGDKTKEEVFEDWSQNEDYLEIKDCSCTNYEIDHEGKTINFESTSCGQYDVREDLDFKDFVFTDEKTFNDIMYYWDNFHCKEVNEEQLKEIEAIIDDPRFKEFHDDFYKFIIDNLDWSVL